jgi:hypothetical protein
MRQIDVRMIIDCDRDCDADCDDEFCLMCDGDDCLMMMMMMMMMMITLPVDGLCLHRF